MELIYYWINKKKCIHEQGFCFSPEYNISMLKVEQGKYELKISRKKENNVFLSDVISNITVLVGDNGAGKTTLLKELWSLEIYTKQINLMEKIFLEIHHISKVL